MKDEEQIEVFKPRNGVEHRSVAWFKTPELQDFEQGLDLVGCWRTIWKCRRAILTIFLAIFGIATIWTLQQKPTYQAKALLEIEREKPDIVTAQDLFTLDSISDVYLETQYKILKSDALAEQVVDQLGLDHVAEFTPRKPWWSRWRKTGSKQVVPTATTERDSATYEATLVRFQRGLEIMPIRRSRLVAISFECWDPDLAARVVNTFVADYIAQSLQVRWDATQKASEWLSRQLTEVKENLKESENELQKYASKNQLLFFQSGSGSQESIVNERLRQLQEELTKMQAERYEKESLYHLIQSGDKASLPGVFENKLIQDLTFQLAELRKQASQLTTNLTPNHPKVKQIQNQINEVEAALSRERGHATERITHDYVAAMSREKAVRQDFEGQQRQANLNSGRLIQYNILKREVDTNKNLYDSLLQRLKETGGSATLKASNIRIVDPGKPPNRPIRPNVPLNLSLAMALGLGVSVGFVFLREMMDETVKSPEQVEHFLHLAPLAFVPTVNSGNGLRILRFHRSGKSAAQPSHNPVILYPKSSPAIDSHAAEQALLSEAFHNLCTSVRLSDSGSPPRSILITSTRSGEGKTTVSINLAIALVELGQRVLLIDSDMRRPTIEKAFDLNGRSGLVSYLKGEKEWRAMVQPAGIEGLALLLCGPIPSNPVELLFSDRAKALVKEAVRAYDYVILDSPPLLSVADARILANFVEVAILVIKSGATPRPLIQRAESCLRDARAQMLGIVLNNFDSGDDPYRRYSRYDYDSP